MVIQNACYEIVFALVGGHTSAMFFHRYELIEFAASVYSPLELDYGSSEIK